MKYPEGATHYYDGSYYKPTGKTGNTWQPTYYRWNEKKGDWNKRGAEPYFNIALYSINLTS